MNNTEIQTANYKSLRIVAKEAGITFTGTPKRAQVEEALRKHFTVVNSETPEDAVRLIARTHTAKNLTVRESTIQLYLIPKLARSTRPAGFEESAESLNEAFRIVGTYAVRVFQEVRRAVELLEGRESELTEKEEAKLEQARKALADVEKQRINGNFDELFDVTGIEL